MTQPSPPFDDALVRHGYMQLEQVRLHYVEAGPDDGPLIVCLHGFPEFWYSWRHQLAFFAARGFRVVAPDLRGYNRSDKPSGVANYRIEALVADIVQFLDGLEADAPALVGHDWGGLVAWWTATWHGDRLGRLAVMNCPHPGHGIDMMASPTQMRKFWYWLFFNLPWLPERRMAARNYGPVRAVFRTEPIRKGAFTPDDIARYVDAMRGATTGAAINYYRAYVRRNPFELRRKLRPIEIPTQVIWGAQDRHLAIEFAEPPAKWVWDLRFDLVEDASHWVQVDRHDRVNELLLEFLGPVRPTT
jgi:pimeloyl-ACP methyl ester carboxylesterase